MDMSKDFKRRRFVLHGFTGGFVVKEEGNLHKSIKR